MYTPDNNTLNLVHALSLSPLVHQGPSHSSQNDELMKSMEAFQEALDLQETSL